VRPLLPRGRGTTGAAAAATAAAAAAAAAATAEAPEAPPAPEFPGSFVPPAPAPSPEPGLETSPPPARVGAARGSSPGFEEIERLCEENARLLQENHLLREEADGLIHDNQELQGRIADVEAAFGEQQAQIEALESQAARADAEIARECALREEAAVSLEGEQALRQETEAALADDEARCADAEVRAADAEARADDAEARLAEAEARATEAEATAMASMAAASSGAAAAAASASASAAAPAAGVTTTPKFQQQFRAWSADSQRNRGPLPIILGNAPGGSVYTTTGPQVVMRKEPVASGSSSLRGRSPLGVLPPGAGSSISASAAAAAPQDHLHPSLCASGRSTPWAAYAVSHATHPSSGSTVVHRPVFASGSVSTAVASGASGTAAAAASLPSAVPTAVMSRQMWISEPVTRMLSTATAGPSTSLGLPMPTMVGAAPMVVATRRQSQPDFPARRVAPGASTMMTTMEPIAAARHNNFT